jgi:hypothetical protein
MLAAPVPDSKKARLRALTFVVAVAASFFASCATKEQPPLVEDPNQQRASSIPWNKPQKWEGKADYPNGLGSPQGY